MLRSTLVYALAVFQVCRLAGLSQGEVVPIAGQGRHPARVVTRLQPYS
jgi:hypothetical protein